VPRDHRVDDLFLQGSLLVVLAPGLELLLELGLQRLQGFEFAERLGEIVVERRKRLLLDLDHFHRRVAAAAAQVFAPMVLGEAQGDLPLLAGAQADHGVVDLGQHVAGADQELVAALAGRVVAVDGERVIDHDEIAGGRRALDRVELRLLLAHVVERGREIVGGDRCRRVLDLDALVFGERDRRLDLDDRDEAEGRALLQPDFLEIGLVDGIELRLGERLTIDVGDQMLGDLTAHVVGEMHLHERARHVALPESGQARLLLHAAVGALPFLLHDVDRRLDGQAPLATFDRFDRDFHRHSRVNSSFRVTSPRMVPRPHAGRHAGTRGARRLDAAEPKPRLLDSPPPEQS
jgi:hypothetical protein